MGFGTPVLAHPVHGARVLPILEGRSTLRENAGNEQAIEAGDEIVIPAGFEDQWEVVTTTRKIYVIFEPTA